MKNIMKWQLKDIKPETILEHSKVNKTSYLFSNILLSRGIVTKKDIYKYFHPENSELYYPFLLTDMNKSVEKIHDIIESDKKILVYGDYDVDGVTSTSLLYLFFLKFSSEVIYYIPDREKEGYGLSKRGIDHAKEKNVSLIITCDCGINSIKEIEYANSKGIETIVTDHHQPDAILPKAFSIIDPKRKNDIYPNKDLAGVGVAYKLTYAYCLKYDIRLKTATDFLDLVALGTAADIVPMKDENRILTYRGIKKINSGDIRIGLAELIRTCDLQEKELNVSDIVFNIAPRLNATGRVSNAKKSIKLLTATEIRMAREYSDILNKENLQRRAIQDDVYESALFQIQEKYGENIPKIIILNSNTWHPGVIGIVSSKIKESFYRPNFLISFRNGIGKGSGRSIKKFNLYNALASSKKYLEGFGGHFAAAGLSIKKQNLENFESSISDYTDKNIDEENLIRVLPIDAEIQLENINATLLKFIDRMMPFGPGNMRPIFCMYKVHPYRAKILKNKHLKFSVKNENLYLDCMGWNMVDKFELIMSSKKEINIAFVPTINEWNGVKNIQLIIKDIKK